MDTPPRRWPTHRWSDPSWTEPGGDWPDVGLDELVVEGWSARELGAIVVDGPLRWSSSSFREQLGGARRFLVERDVGPGDVVVVQSANRWEVLALAVATWRSGAIFAPVAARMGRHGTDHVVATVQPQAVVAEEHLALADHPGAHVLTIDPIEREAPSFDMGDAAAERVDIASTEPAVMLFTGGTTGPPKAVLHSHASLAGKARRMVQVHGLRSNDAVLMPAPFSHMSGLLNGILVPGAAGMKVVVMPRWSPERAASLIRAEKITFMVGPTTFFTGIERVARDRDAFAALASLRLVSVGGAEVRPQVVDDLSRTLRAVVKRSYGSTEAPTVTTSHVGDPDDTAATTDGRRCSPQTEIRIVDPATGDDVAPGTIGEIVVRGPEVMIGYLHVEADPISDDGWFHTGDLGSMVDGWLTVVSRLDLRIIRAGENIDVVELESAIASHPGIGEVVVVGEPHRELGHRVTAFVTTADASGAPAETPSCPELSDWLVERGLQRVASPERLVVLDELPVQPSGKHDRVALTAAATQAAVADGTWLGEE